MGTTSFIFQYISYESGLYTFKEQNCSGKYRLSFNGQNILERFKQKYQEMKQTTYYYQRSKTSKPEWAKTMVLKDKHG